MRIFKKNRFLKRLFKRIMPQTLFARSLLILVTPIILIQMVSTFMFFDRHWGRMTSRLAYAVAGEITWIASEIEANPTPDNVAKISVSAMENLNLLLAYRSDEKLDVQKVSTRRIGWESMIGAALQQELDGRIERPYTVDVDFQGEWVEIRVQLKGGVLSISLPQRRLFSSSSYIFLIWVFSVSFVLLVIAILFMRNQIRPIRRLAIAAERFGKGRDVSDFKLEGAKEVRQAGQAFLDMRTRIQRQITQRTEMLAGVSHDLRTPLTRLKLQIAMFGDHPDAQAMKGDIQDMERMIEGYLDFVRGEGREKTEIVDVVEMLRNIVFSTKRQGFHAELETGIIENVYMPLRPSAFKRCLENIMTNAGRYGDCVWLTLLRIDEGTIEIIIEDNGPGIPENQYEDVFRPFYRVDSSRNMQTGGIGLGLPIAMDIVHAHGGKIWLDKSKSHGGLAAHIRLPL